MDLLVGTGVATASSRKGISPEKKTAVLSGIARITSPPHPPNLGNLFNFSDVEIHAWKVS